MAYIPGASFSYTPSYSVPTSASQPTRFNRHGYGNVYQQNLGGRTPNPMDFSLYTDYYSPVPAKSLGEMARDQINQFAMKAPRGYAGNLWYGLPQNSGIAGWRGAGSITMG